MDLPTCPACGQSVLDDDAAHCPFCGAAMDGKKTAKEPTAVKKKKATQKKISTPDDDDPFAVAKSPTEKGVIQCARKPVRGRTTRVVCPMCDSQGFLPKSAIGKQVRCANKDCLVPVFTAMGKNGQGGKPTAPSRTSQESKPPRKTKSNANTAKKPYALYAIAGFILIAGTAGLLAYLNREGETSLAPRPINRPAITRSADETDEPEEVIEQSKQTEIVETPDYHQQALQLVEEMITHSRVNTGNRDKAFCRLLTADAYLRLGEPSKAESEFQQMARVSRDLDRDTEYYKVLPLLTLYWKAIESGEKSAERKYLQQANDLKDRIPSRGNLAIRSGIHLAAGLVHSGDLKAAAAVCAKLEFDRTVESRIDSVNAAAWESLFLVLSAVDRPPYSPIAMQLWHQPIETAVCAELAIRQQWDAAIAWANSLQNEDTAADALSIVCREAIRAQYSAITQKMAAATASRNPWFALRIEAVLASANPENWENLKTKLNAIPDPNPAEKLAAEVLVESRLPNANQDLRTAAAYAEAAITASLQNDQEIAVRCLNLMERQTAATIPRASVVRQMASDVQDRKLTEEMLSKTLGIRDPNRLKPQFFRFRNSVDRLQKLSEYRRQQLIFLVCHVIQECGTDALNQALTTADSDLKKELAMDQAQNFLYVAAALKGVSFPEATQVNQELLIPLKRMDPTAEQVIAPTLAEAAKGALEGQFQAVKPLENVRQRQGLCSSVFRSLIAKRATKETVPTALVTDLLSLRNDLLREQSLMDSARAMTLNGLMAKTIGAISANVKNPSQQVAALHGIVNAAVVLEQRETSP